MKFISTPLFYAVLTVGILANQVSVKAQNARITHTIVQQHHAAPQMGRDLWFSMIKNYDDQGGKYYTLYVTSPQQTNIYVNMAGQATKVLPVQPYSVASFNIPLGWEIKTSAIVEIKAIHVWSEDGDICAYLMSHNPYTSDGMKIIPSIGWGTDYVVAAYGALYEGFGSYNYDFPSEFVIVANRDNTICTITPSTDIRLESSPHACKTCVAHPKGIPFIETLQKGQAIQYESLVAQDDENYDMTGTIVHSNNPIGVVAGSMCPNIPMAYPYCDHVCEMIPPVRTWGKTYISAPFYPASPGKQWSSFLVMGSKANQMIYRSDPTSQKSPYCILSAQYATYFRSDIDQPSKWESDDPFLLVQYINSPTYPDGNNAQGDPAEVVLCPVEQWSKSVVIQTPKTIGNQSPYKNYVNILVNNNAVKSTLFDGQHIFNYTKMLIDKDYSVYRVDGVNQGAHPISSDSGVGAYVYGYGYDESYAWPGSMGTATFQSPDTIAPKITPSGSCFSAHVALLDSGINQSMLSYIRLDSIYNMAYNRTDAHWSEGYGLASSFYDMYVIDSTKQAFLKIAVFDQAGNESLITSKYIPQIARIAPPLRGVGIGNIKGTPIYFFDTIVNTGQTPFAFTTLSLLHGAKQSGFAIDSAILTPLAVGETRMFKLSFVPLNSHLAFDTIVFSDACLRQQAVVFGSGGGPDFQLTDYDFGTLTILDQTNSARQRATSDRNARPQSPGTHLVNLSKTKAIIIDSIWSDDPHFVFDDASRLPLTIPASGDVPVQFTFTPASLGNVTTQWHARSQSVDTDGKPLGTRDAILRGSAAMHDQAFFGDKFFSPDCLKPTDSVHILDTIVATGTLGTVIANVTHSAAGNPQWTNFSAFTENGHIADFTKGPEALKQYDLLVISEDFHPSLSNNTTMTDTITMVTSEGRTMHVTSTIDAPYRAGSVSPTAINFAPVPFGGTAPPTQFITIRNTELSNLIVTDLYVPPGSKYENSFIFNLPISLPVTLKAGESMSIGVDFDPTASHDSNQWVRALVEWNSCVAASPIVVSAQWTGAVARPSSADPLQASLGIINGGTGIQVFLPATWASSVTLEIDNLLGVKVYSRTFPASDRGPFELTDLANGSYFYRLSCGSEFTSGKLVIQR